MLNLQKFTIDLCVEELRRAYERTCSNEELRPDTTQNIIAGG